jgi:MFS family permease
VRTERIPREPYVLAVAMFCIVAATNILTPLLPDIRGDFGVSIATAGVIVGSYGLARLVTDLPAGLLADRIGHARISIVALVLLAASCVVGWNAASVDVLVGARVAAGVAVAILATVILSSLGATATAANRGKVMSFFHVANNVGIALYPLVGGVIGAALGWRATFVVTLVLAVVAGGLLIPVLLRIRPASSASARARVGDGRVLAGRERVSAIVATNIGVVANFINRHGFRNTILPLYAATSLGLGGVSIATAIALMSATGLLVATPGGALGDRIGRRRIITTGLAAVAVGDLVFLLTNDLVTFLAASALIGLGDFFSSSQTALLSEVVPPEQRTRILSTYRFSADLGAFIGPVLLAAVMDIANAQLAIIVAVVILLLASAAARIGVPRVVDERVRAPSLAPVLEVAADGSE